MTHDLKNPLGVIDGSAELLELGARGELTAEQRSTTGTIRKAAAEMLGTINDLLELSRAEAATLSIRRRDVEVNGLVLEAVRAYRPAVEKEGLDLEFVPLPEDRHIVTDPEKVREILGNLLTNAAKHAAAGGRVTVEVSLRRTDSAPRIAATVSDNGPGIPSGSEDEIFAEFVRGGESGGSGLGLAIARKLARCLGGDLVLDEPPASGGATFTLELPLGTESERGAIGSAG